MTRLPGQEAEGAGLGNEVEGYLLWQATIAVAEQRAREFTERMDCLTTAQREEIEQLHVSDSLRRAKQDLERVAARCRSLRGEYDAAALCGIHAGRGGRSHLGGGRRAGAEPLSACR
uniref:cytochrome C oxidase subunit I n=1 Tax=Streptomyces corallincola TaxID=2851888 RepID=UPI001FE45357|nr:cytochrome C oxidase subunit I [Streptomyces corallincola]